MSAPASVVPPREHRRALFTTFAIALAARVAVAVLSPPAGVGAAAAIALAVLWAGWVFALYRWMIPTQDWRVVHLACVLFAVYPPAWALPGSVLWVVWLVLLGGFPAPGTRPAASRWRYLAVGAAAFVLVQVVAAWRQAPPADSPWAFWALAPADAPLRAMLAGYLFKGPLFCLAFVGAFFWIREAGEACLVPLLIVALAWVLNWQSSADFTVAGANPILAMFAANGLWRIYVGLGRTSGHGILAIDPIKDKRPARPREAQPDA